MTERVGFAAGLPLSAVAPGTTLLVVGDDAGPGRDLCLRLLGGERGDGALVVTTSAAARRVLEPCETEGGRFDLSRLPLVAGPAGEAVPTRVLAVRDPKDLTAVGLRMAGLHGDLDREGAARVRTGVVSLSPLVAANGVTAVSRFVNAVAGRVGAHDGLGALLVDPQMVEPAVIETLATLCGGRLDAREGEDGLEVRVDGVPDQPDGWRPAPLEP